MRNGRLLQMRPYPAGQDLPDRRLVHAVEPPNFSHRHGAGESSNSPNVIVAELARVRGTVNLGMRVRAVSAIPSFVGAISVVYGSVAKEKVIQANTSSVVAGVQYAHPQRDVTIGQPPRHSMSAIVPTLKGQPAISVPQSRSPFLTVSNRCDVSPEGRPVHGTSLS